MKCIDDYIETKLINKDNFADIYVFAIERKFNTLVEMSKKFISNKIKDCVDQDIEQVIKLNDKTNNSLLEIVVNKYLSNLNKYNRIQSYNSTNLILDGRYYTCNPSAYLKDVIKLD